MKWSSFKRAIVSYDCGSRKKAKEEEREKMTALTDKKYGSCHAQELYFQKKYTYFLGKGKKNLYCKSHTYAHAQETKFLTRPRLSTPMMPKSMNEMYMLIQKLWIELLCRDYWTYEIQLS